MQTPLKSTVTAKVVIVTSNEGLSAFLHSFGQLLYSNYSDIACVLTAKVGNCGGTGAHVVCVGSRTTSELPAKTDPYYAGTLQEAPGSAVCHHAST